MSILSNVELIMTGAKKQGQEAPSVADMRTALTANGFNVERAEDIPLPTAFRRAVKGLEDKDHKVVCWDTKGTTHAQLDKLVADGDGESAKLVRQPLHHWRLNDEGKVLGEATEGDLGVQHHKDHYIWGDVTRIIREILDKDSFGSYTPRAAGGVYFVPTTGREFLDRLEAACRAVGLALLRYQIPDTAEQRGEISQAIADHLDADLALHAQAIGTYTVEQTRAGVVRNRIESLVEVRRLIGSLSSHLSERAAALLAKCADLEAKCADMVRAIETARPIGTGRRVVTTPAESAAAESVAPVPAPEVATQESLFV